MNFPIERRNSCFLNTAFFLLASCSALGPVAPLHAAEPTYSFAQAQEQAGVWKAEAARFAKAGQTEEAAKAEAAARTWEAYAQQAQAATTKAAQPAPSAQPAQGNASAPAGNPAQTAANEAALAAQQAALKARQEYLAEQQAKLAEQQAQADRLKNGLTAAVTGGDYNQAKNFINQGATSTPELVQMAVDGGYTGIAYLLMKSGAQIDNGMLGKALIRAVSMQDRDRVNNLIKLGANINHAEGEVTPLSAAARNGDLGLIGILLAAGAHRDPNELGRVMFAAVEQGEREKAANLLKMGANPNYAKDGSTAFSTAVDRGDYGMASVLVAGGATADPRVLGKALFTSAERGEADKVALLLKMGADVNYSANGITPLTIAIQGENLEMANLLIRSGATDASGRYGRKTFEAALAGDMAWLNILSKIPSYATYRNPQGETPLHAAASTGQTGAVATLLAVGVDPNVLTPKNWTPLHHAARFGHQLALMHLLKAGADVYAVNSDGNDAFKLAGLAMRDSKNEIDSTGVINYLKLWMNFHPRP